MRGPRSFPQWVQKFGGFRWLRTLPCRRKCNFKAGTKNLRTPSGIGTKRIENTPFTSRLEQTRASQLGPSDPPASAKDVQRKPNDSTPVPECGESPGSSSNLASKCTNWPKRKPVEYVKDGEERVQVTSEILTTGSRDAEDATQCDAEQSFVAETSLASTGQSHTEDESDFGGGNLLSNSRTPNVHFHSNNVRYRHRQCSRIAFPR